MDLRNKIIEEFDEIIRNDSNLTILEGVFDSINQEDSNSLVSEEHYKKKNERRKKYLTGETNGASWQELRESL